MRCNLTLSFRARYLKHTTWLPYGSCLVFLSVRTIGMEWEHQLKELQPALTTTKEDTSFQGSGWVQLFFKGECVYTHLHNAYICIYFISTYIYLKLNSIPLVEILRLEVWRLPFFCLNVSFLITRWMAWIFSVSEKQQNLQLSTVELEK